MPVGLERPFLREGIAGQRGSLRSLRDLYAHRGRIGRGDACRAEHGVLRENFVVDLGHEIVLTISVTSPYLPELDGIYRHIFCLLVLNYLQTTDRLMGPSIAVVVTDGHGSPMTLSDSRRVRVTGARVAAYARSGVVDDRRHALL
jgi:hypothetical protein